MVAYSKCMEMFNALRLFKEMGFLGNVVAWTAMISGFLQNEGKEEALDLFWEMRRKGVRPNEFTYSVILTALPVISPSEVHAQVVKTNYERSSTVGTALLDAYVKLGKVDEASKVFNGIDDKDIVAWSAMLAGYAQTGETEAAIKMFSDLTKGGIKPNEFTFSSILNVCAATTASMGPGKQFHGLAIKSRLDFSCMRVHKKTELGRSAAEKIIEMKPEDLAAYVLLSNMYAESGDWQERAKVRKLMNERNVKKEAAYSWIEVKNKTYVFLAGDRSHPLQDQIYMKLEDLSTRLKDLGYKPDTSYVLQDIDDELKEAVLAQHSERLAIAFELISTPKGSPLLIIKNLRVCGDCHVVIKLIAKIEEREIVVRDTNRFHHFSSDGVCSCGHFW
ncbi:Pentatricopeptide repeat-containing protein [Cardamine amara subsp. amara]|uniref:Pentatricopeptide repeat-containing protein n=1 Tax=Cardamine amara subsp. amara TaxID=228776 RepID=A0ABD1ABG1_CARAN